MKPSLQELAVRPKKIITNNRKALFDFEVLQKFEAGIILQGTEVKSLRAGKCQLQDAFCQFRSKRDDELMLIGCHIAPYEFGNRMNHTPLRPRKLLLKSNELSKLHASVNEKGLTIVPISIYFSGPYVKLEIALVKPRKKYDKRENLKEKDAKRDMDRTKKSLSKSD